jgi:N6-adenosine-specific RNA methylase IME4
VTVELVLYERARQALAEAKTIDEIKDVRDRALALQLYAKQALDRELINAATDIRVRAERKAGERLREMRESGERKGWGGDQRSSNASLPEYRSLADLGIGKMQSSRWQKLSELPQADFETRLAAMQKRAVEAMDMTPEERSAAKKQRRAAHEEALATQIRALPSKRFGLIFADPEWEFVPYSEETGSDRSAANHYATSTLADIKARDVPSIAADDCVLALCATVPMLPQALEVMQAWGFEYRSHCVWLKSKVSTGYWFRNVHELLLIGVKGDVPAPAPGEQWESAFDADTREHSEKPEEMYRMLEQYFPTLPKIELNARARRDGWDVWGAEAPAEEAAAE